MHAAQGVRCVVPAGELGDRAHPHTLQYRVHSGCICMTTHLRLAGALRLLETLQVLIRARLADFLDFSNACTGPCAILVLHTGRAIKFIIESLLIAKS